MMQLPLENLTPRQREAYILRFRWGWRLPRIAAELGITATVTDGLGGTRPALRLNGARWRLFRSVARR